MAVFSFLLTEGNQMRHWTRGILDSLGLLAVWLVLAIGVALTAFQIHATLLFLGLLIVENPTFRPSGWSTNTIHSLSRILVLILGAFWLGFVVFLESYLREGRDHQVLRLRVLRLISYIVGIYIFSSGALFILS